MDDWIQSTTAHNWTTEYSQQLHTTGQLNTVNNILYTAGQLNTVKNSTQLDNWIQSTTVHNWTTEYSQQLDNWLQSTTVHNWTTEYSQQLYNWLQSTTVHNWTTEYSQQLYNWLQSTTVHNWTTEYSQQLYPTGELMQWTTIHKWSTEYSPQLNLTGQLKTVNNGTQVNNWMQSIIVHSLKTEHSWLVALRSLFSTSTISTNYCKCVANFLLKRLFKQTLAFLPWYTAWFPEQGLRHWLTNRLNQKFITRMNWLLGSSFC